MPHQSLSAARASNYAHSPQWHGDKFHNTAPRAQPGFFKLLAISWRLLFGKPAASTPAKPVPVEALTRAQLLAAPDQTLFRLGHSTVLMKLRGEFWLTDPVFSRRASPLQWLGPKRFHQPPIAIEDLPPIKGVILSHDHYDHLDRAAVLQLQDKVEHFLTPLGVGDTLLKWGVPAGKIRQLDWWESTTVAGVRFVATPSQHFSGRGLADGDSTLWASWSILQDGFRVFFSGDSGYFAGFKEIGDKYGPFDLTLMETGAYDQDWPDIHMQPEQTLQAHLDLRGKQLMPIHNGTFDLALHAWHEPFDRIVALAESHGVKISTPRMGEALDMAVPARGESWWLQVD
ncbi:hydrolase [Chitinimonas arctica]|uniref:Hydrolase n=1 Tax=Chitinimonas arctica TaxID=2594795 RepID=A0A516SLH3_9NEIS|nr:MBL fold metallo-hydrolase [Chitinimonas arctica]QDQ28858.1 hydrolase [Chitinimonas arctica]